MNEQGQGSGRPFTLAAQAPSILPDVHRLALLRAAVERHPGRAALREKLAYGLLADDDFDGAIALFEPLADERPSFALLLTLNDAYLARRTRDDDRRAEAAGRRAAALAGDDRQRAAALAALGKALIRQDRLGEARAALTDALLLDRHHVDAWKRLATIIAGDGAPAMLAAADALIGQGVAHTGVLATRAAALAMAGRADEAREAIGLDRFLAARRLPLPPGWATHAALQEAVERELSEHPDIRYDREGTASRMTWRVERPLTARTPALAALQEAIRDAVVDYVDRAGHDADTSWWRARPAAASLHFSCVMTDADGYEDWHLHQHGWLSGVYYVAVPPAVADATGKGGCLAFGLPGDTVGAEAAAAHGERIVRPEPGLMLLFPSHAHHRTFAHGCAGRRICLAFDVRPDAA